jgi:hypothetical protein
MNDIDLKSFLRLKVIWKDNDMFELEVKTSNIHFSGKTEVYDQSESLSEFALKLTNFPNNEMTLYYEMGEKDSYAYFSISFYPIDLGGHIGVEIYLESSVPTEYRKEEKHKLKLEFIVEPSAIDNFQKELFTLTKNREGTAILFGIDK